jgi:hypothetical protein
MADYSTLWGRGQVERYDLESSCAFWEKEIRSKEE